MTTHSFGSRLRSVPGCARFPVALGSRVKAALPLLIAAAATFSAMTGRAYAGEWVVSYEITGGSTATDAGSTSRESSADYGVWSGAEAGTLAPLVSPNTIQLPANTKAKAHTNLTVKVSVDWVTGSDAPDELPTDKLWLIERSMACAQVVNHDVYSPTFQPIGIDTLGVSNPIETSQSLSFDGYWTLSTGAPQAVRYDNANRKTHLDLVTRTFVADGIASIPPADFREYASGLPPEGGAKTSVHYSAHAYTKEVALVRWNAHNETIDADGNLHGDTLYSRRSTFFDSESGCPMIEEGLNWVPFFVCHAGTWDFPSTTGVWSPAHSEATLYWNKWAMVHGGTSWVDGQLTGTPIGPVQGTMTYTATDSSDGGSDDAKYFLTVHEPFKKKGTETVTTVLENVHVVSKWVTGADDTDKAILSVDRGSQWTVGVGLGGNIEAAKSAALEFGVEASHTWVYTVTTGMTVDLPTGWRVRLMAGNYVKVHEGLSDACDTGGLIGDASWEVRVPDGETIFHGPLEYVGDPNGGGDGQ